MGDVAYSRAKPTLEKASTTWSTLALMTVDFKLAKDITVDSVTAGDSKLNSDGLTITGGPPRR